MFVSGAGGGVTDRILKEVSHGMRFWEIADAPNPTFFPTSLYGVLVFDSVSWAPPSSPLSPALLHTDCTQTSLHRQ